MKKKRNNKYKKFAAGVLISSLALSALGCAKKDGIHMLIIYL